MCFRIFVLAKIDWTIVRALEVFLLLPLLLLYRLFSIGLLSAYAATAGPTMPNWVFWVELGVISAHSLLVLVCN